MVKPHLKLAWVCKQITLWKKEEEKYRRRKKNLRKSDWDGPKPTLQLLLFLFHTCWLWLGTSCLDFYSFSSSHALSLFLSPTLLQNSRPGSSFPWIPSYFFWCLFFLAKLYNFSVRSELCEGSERGATEKKRGRHNERERGGPEASKAD